LLHDWFIKQQNSIAVLLEQKFNVYLVI